MPFFPIKRGELTQCNEGYMVTLCKMSLCFVPYLSLIILTGIIHRRDGHGMKFNEGAYNWLQHQFHLMPLPYTHNESLVTECKPVDVKKMVGVKLSSSLWWFSTLLLIQFFFLDHTELSHTTEEETGGIRQEYTDLPIVNCRYLFVPSPFSGARVSVQMFSY